jgi:S-adenosylmethionine synthetase
MEVSVHRLEGPTTQDRPVEIVERKGLGHPDSICDAIADAFARRLCHFYLERFGAVLHHNVDKVLLRGGVARAAFGGGEILEPIELWLCGRATESYRGVAIPIAELGEEVARTWFRRHLHAFDPEKHLRVHCITHPGSSDLVELFGASRRGDVFLANDTSCGVGYAPSTPLERAVLKIERELNAGPTKRLRPAWGEDVKVLGFRRGLDVSLTVACALVGGFVPDIHAYQSEKQLLAESADTWASAELGRSPELVVNAADDLARGEVYLTVTGTSAEAGDDGEVGRGNRANGLITPFRPMTLEADAGKNPLTHVGKIYSLIAPRIAAAIVEQVDSVEEAHCALVGRIGAPVFEPSLVSLELRIAPEAPFLAIQRRAEECARALLERLASSFWREWIDTDPD